MKYNVTQAIQDGLSYLATVQNPDGSFTSYLDVEKNNIKDKKPHRTTFVSSLILSALAGIREAEPSQSRALLVRFVQSQKEDNWTYNYWAKDEPNRKTSPYPNDLDDTFCAYNALLKTDEANITPEVLAAITKILIATETKPGGPYKTWVVAADSEKIWLDIDPVVNSNIAYFLSKVAVIPSWLQKYLSEAIRDQKLLSPYYPTIYPTLYYMSRCSIENTADYLKLLPKNDKGLSVVEVALVANTYFHLGEYILGEYFIKHLLQMQRSDGSWPATGFSIDRIEKSVSYYSGCAALTTALALEALAQYRHKEPKQKKDKPRLPQTESYDTKQVFDHASSLYAQLPTLLRNQIEGRLDAMRRGGNGDEILKNAITLNGALKRPINTRDPIFLALGSANLYGWAAYTIYDDFIDDEGDPTLLSAANAAHRISYKTFLEALPNKEFQAYVDQIFNTIDEANTWESLYCRSKTNERLVTIARLPDYADLYMLAHRSMGHLLPPLAVLVSSGSSTKSKDFMHLEQSLTHYLIAKQLNDDAHDWSDDFNNGHMSYVVTLILRELCIVDGTYDKETLHDTMQRRFWHHTILNVCDEIERNINLSKEALGKMRCLKNENRMHDTLERIRKSVDETRKQQKETVEFLSHYRSK